MYNHQQDQTALLQQILQQGMQHFQNGNLSEAIDCCNRALDINPNLEEVWYNKGVCLHVQRKYQEAIESFDQALKIKPDYAAPYQNKGNCLINLQRYQEAMECYKQAQNLSPQFVEQYKNRINKQNIPQKISAATQQLDQALNLKNTYYQSQQNQQTSTQSQNQTEQYSEIIPNKIETTTLSFDEQVINLLQKYERNQALVKKPSGCGVFPKKQEEQLNNIMKNPSLLHQLNQITDLSLQKVIDYSNYFEELGININQLQVDQFIELLLQFDEENSSRFQVLQPFCFFNLNLFQLKSLYNNLLIQKALIYLVALLVYYIT